MINKSTLSQYIDFLHKKRKGTEASQDLINQWNQIDDKDVRKELENLYQFWRLSPEDVRSYENEFQALQELRKTSSDSQSNLSQLPEGHQRYERNTQKSQVQQQPYSPYGFSDDQYQSYQPPPRKKGVSTSGIIVIVLGLLIGLTAIGYYGYNTLNKPEVERVVQDKKVMNDNRTVEEPVTPKKEVVKVDIDSSSVINEEDRNKKIKAITSLLKAEENRDFTSIIAHFSPAVDQYWDLKQPSKEKIYELYEGAWSKALDISYKNVSVQRISEEVYEMTGDYSYYSIKDDEYKNFKIKNRYEFDKEGKIRRAYGATVK